MLDAGKAKSELGWHTLLSAKERVSVSIQWYKNHLTGKATAYELVKKDIKKIITSDVTAG
jgi:hypothetical protein